MTAILLVVGRQWWRGPRVSGPLPHEAYVWQRSWNGPVRAAIQRSAPTLDGVVVLGAEVSWTDGRAEVARPTVDYALLRQSGADAGVALRIGPFAGPFSENDDTSRMLAGLAGELLDATKAGGLAVDELQVDFDCAESRLDDYILWVRAIRRAAGRVPVVITALPSWLDNRAFRRLARTADGYVLQVHSLERPDRIDTPMTLCDPAAARRAVEAAGRIGVPFRVALPTYGYQVAFDRDGRFLGLRAEGRSAEWPADVRIRVVQADVAAMADLVRRWTADRPACMRGLIWYRLPTDADALNWRWQTLAAVMAGRVPVADVQVEARRTEPGLYELEMTNSGDADGVLPDAAMARWRDAELTAADALGGYEMVDRTANSLAFRRTQAAVVEWIRPDERRAIGWLRLNADREVHVDVPVQTK